MFFLSLIFNYNHVISSINSKNTPPNPKLSHTIKSNLVFHLGWSLGPCETVQVYFEASTGSLTLDSRFSIGTIWTMIKQHHPIRTLFSLFLFSCLTPTVSKFLWRLTNFRLPIDSSLHPFSSRCAIVRLSCMITCSFGVKSSLESKHISMRCLSSSSYTAHTVIFHPYILSTFFRYYTTGLDWSRVHIQAHIMPDVLSDLVVPFFER